MIYNQRTSNNLNQTTLQLGMKQGATTGNTPSRIETTNECSTANVPRPHLHWHFSTTCYHLSAARAWKAGVAKLNSPLPTLFEPVKSYPCYDTNALFQQHSLVKMVAWSIPNVILTGRYDRNVIRQMNYILKSSQPLCGGCVWWCATVSKHVSQLSTIKQDICQIDWMGELFWKNVDHAHKSNGSMDACIRHGLEQLE